MIIFETDASTNTDAAVAATLGQGFIPLAVQDPTTTPEGRPATWGESAEAALAAARRDNELAATFDMLRQDLHAERPAADWNPYRFIRDNWDEARRTRARRWISEGLFDGGTSPDHLSAIERELVRWEDESKLMARASVASFIGSAVGGNLSLTTLAVAPLAVPVRGASLLATVARTALGNAAGSALQEAALLSQQPLREFTDSLLNVGVAGVLGGGIGALSHALLPSHPLSPSNPANPLRVDNLSRADGAVFTPDAGMEPIPRSAGAAAADADATVWTRAAPERMGGEFTAAATDWFTGFAGPAGRALRWSSEAARRALGGVIDISGYSRTDLDGTPRGLSAEAVRDDLLADYEGQRLVTANTIRQVDQQLAELGQGRVRGEDFNFATLRYLTSLPDADEAWAPLVQRYGAEGAEKVKTAAQSVAEGWHRLNERMEARLRELGALRDDQRISQIASSLERVRKDFDTRLDKLAKEIEATKPPKGAELTPEQREAAARRGDELRLAQETLRAERQAHTGAIEAALRQEKARPAALGRDYGMAQLWDKATVAADPEAFRAFLTRVLAKDVDEAWLRETHGLEKGDLDRLATEEPDRYRDIVAEWGGDERAWAVERLNRRLDVLRAVEKGARLDLRSVLRQLRHASELASSSERTVARTAARGEEARLNAARAEKDELTAQRAAVDQVLALAAERETQRALQAAERQAKAGPVADDTVLSRLTAALDRVDPPEGPTPGALPSAPRPRHTERLARLERRKAELDRRLKSADARSRQAGERLRLLSDALERVETSRAERKALAGERAKLAAEGERRTAELAQGIAGTERKLASTLKRPALADVVDDIVRAIGQGHVMPTGGLDDTLTEGARLKERRITLTPAEREEAMKAGFLRDDLPNVLELQYRQLAGHIALREALSIGPRSHHRFKSYGDVRRLIEDDYERLKADAPDARAKARLEREKRAALRDFDVSKSRVTGMTDPGIDRDSWAFWMSKKAQQANFVRFGPGMLVSALVDPAATILRHSLVRDIVPHMREIVGTLRGADPKSVLAMVNASEPAIMGFSRVDHVDPQELADGFGIGPRGTRTHDVTAAVDKAMASGTRWAAVLSGLGAWGRFWKTAAAVAMTRKMLRELGRYDSLSAARKADLASLGLGKEEAERLHGFLTKHGETDEAGRFDPNLDAWAAEPGGVEAARDYRIAIARDLRRAVITPGSGDTPVFMDNWMGKLLLQFQSFAFATVNRYLVPMAQRVAYLDGWRDGQVLASITALMLTTATSLAVKDLTRGKDPLERWSSDKLDETAREMVDRSGMLGYLAPYANAALQTAGLGASSRFAQNSAWESLLGVNYGLVSQAAKAAASLSADGVQNGEWAKVRDKVVAIAPFVMWARIANMLGQEMAR